MLPKIPYREWSRFWRKNEVFGVAHAEAEAAKRLSSLYLRLTGGEEGESWDREVLLGVIY